MKTIIAIVIMLGLYSCSNTILNDDNPPPCPPCNSFGVQFVDEMGYDASDRIEMELIEKNTTIPPKDPTYPGDSNFPSDYTYYNDHYEMVSEKYSYKCFFNRSEIPSTYGITENDVPLKSIIELKITKGKTDEVKTFWFRAVSDYIMTHDNGIYPYEFEYKFKIPSLFGEKDNVIKVIKKRIGVDIYEKVTFNGEEILNEYGKPFKIVVKN